ncbi:thioesterase [Streptomyces laurentii]|uniref:Thioesterase n=1 Tax=Streptomyces laurentii TaxID=39478 RepID=A0A160P6M0_STRLU|nr:thioesterase [Streptomyces laurentii]
MGRATGADSCDLLGVLGAVVDSGEGEEFGGGVVAVAQRVLRERTPVSLVAEVLRLSAVTLVRRSGCPRAG